MTNEEEAEKYVKNEVCIKLCPTWKAHGEKCDLFPKCHYVSSKIKFYRLGLEKENAELKEKQRADGQCEACKLGDLIVENAKLKKENIKLRERLNSVNKSNDEYEMMYRKSIDEHNENIQLKAQIENMKNFYNCSYSSRALCPNEHKCNGCKDWGLAE